MPFDTVGFSLPKSNFEQENCRVYVCDCGNIRIETRHFRQSFTPIEFVAFLREKLEKKRKTKNRALPVLQSGTMKQNKLCSMNLVKNES